jgi:DNA-binding MarR family transcriptional regulator
MQLASTHADLVDGFAGAWQQLEGRLGSALNHIKGISLAEYRMLRRLAEMPDSSASRVALASAVGLTPSGVTRALQPLEKLGYVETVKSDRDARLALARLTAAGEELVSDAAQVVDDTMTDVLGGAPGIATNRSFLLKLLHELAD